MSLIWSFSSLVEDPIGLRALLKAKDKARVERMIAKAEGLPTVLSGTDVGNASRSGRN